MVLSVQKWLRLSSSVIAHHWLTQYDFQDTSCFLSSINSHWPIQGHDFYSVIVFMPHSCYICIHLLTQANMVLHNMVLWLSAVFITVMGSWGGITQSVGHSTQKWFWCNNVTGQYISHNVSQLLIGTWLYIYIM